MSYGSDTSYSDAGLPSLRSRSAISNGGLKFPLRDSRIDTRSRDKIQVVKLGRTMDNVRELLAKKGGTVWSVGPDDAVIEAIRIMAERGSGALAVLDSGALVGIISERDYVRKIALKSRSSEETLVREIMTLRVIYATPDQRIENCMAIMNQNNIRHMPVLENGNVVGMLSLKDLVNVIIERQQSIIEELETFVLG